MTPKGNLLDLIEYHKLFKIIESFTKATDITIDINDSQGYPLVQHPYFYGFCKAIRMHPVGLERCIDSNAQVGFETAKKRDICFRECHAGVMLLGVPIVVEGQFWGSIVCGQFHLQEPSPQMVGQMLNNTADLNIPRDILLKTYGEIKVISSDKCMAASELINFLANYLAEIVYKGKMEAQLHQEKIRAVEAAKAKVELENMLRTAQIKTLEAQIKPHFLFNTLNVIARLISLEQGEKALQVTYALARLLRQCLEHPGELVTVGQELEYVKNYLLIQQTRFGQRLEIEWEVDHSVLNVPIPFLSIQPLVENACIHGLEPKEGPGKLRITGKRHNGELEISIEDNGVGFPQPDYTLLKAYLAGTNHDQEAMNESTGIGLKNVHQRVRHYFGPQYGVSISGSPGKTVVTIRLPSIIG